MCPFCLSENLDWTVAKGTGKVHSYTVVRRVTNPAFRDDVPYVLAVVELDEGPHLTTNVVGCAPEAVRVDMEVKATYDDVTSQMTLVKFEPSTRQETT
jgi:uncharacterized OB-fold protein